MKVFKQEIFSDNSPHSRMSVGLELWSLLKLEAVRCLTGRWYKSFQAMDLLWGISLILVVYIDFFPIGWISLCDNYDVVPKWNS